MVLAAVILFQAFSFRARAVPGRARRQRRVVRLWVALQQRALRLLAAVAHRVDRAPPGLFLSQRLLHLQARRWVADAQVHGARVLRRLLVPGDSLIADVRVRCRDFPAEHSAELRFHRGFAPVAPDAQRAVPRRVPG